MFTEADPMSSMIMPIVEPLVSPDAVDAGENPWGATTYVGRPRRTRHAPRADSEARAPSDPATEAAVQVADVEPGDAPAGDAAQPAAPTAAPAKGLMANSRSMALASLASRITGFLRSVLLVAALGVGAVGNAYNSGNNLPNMIYELLLGGVLSSVLIPLLIQAESEDEDDGLAYTQRLLSIATVALGVMTLLVTLAAPWIAAAFVDAGPQRQLTSIFATLLLPEIFFYGVGAMFMAVLNIKHVYGPGAWAPLLNNVVLMVTIGVFWLLPGPATLNPSTMTTAQVLVVGIGTTLGIAAQALVLVPYLRRTGFRWAWRFRARPGESNRLRELGSLGVWVLGYVVVSQVGVSVIQRIGNSNGGFSVFTQADLLFQMPYGILVVSVLTAIMPRLSRAAVRNDHDAVVGDLALGARLSAVALVPITALLIVLGPVLGVTLFAHGQSSYEGARLIGTSLAWSAFGLFPFALVMLQLRVFYAMRDGRTPTLINAFMVATKVVLVLVTSAVFAAPPGTDVDRHPSVHAVEWLNISTSLSYVVGAVVGQILLARRLGHLRFRSVLATVTRIGLISAIGAAAAFGVVELVLDAIGRDVTGSAVGLVAGGVVGLGVLGAVAWRARIPDVQEVLVAARR
ncbi:murein biosynthesis integral membrane protein MurJ [uncultured Jatrophihabitans sp.]|uniref:murein biosynthesis integral membrane protein MurJ n=1 Tax=uncultured Jatrophihabitans sp. TaxID=1610747 RepID=UPI0035CC9DF8